jgi:hypothetical protein
MKTTLLLSLAFSFFTPLKGEENKTPVPPELQALAESLLTAIKAQDNAAISACWHTPEVLAKRKVAEEQAKAALNIKEVNAEKEADKERKRREKDLEYTLHRMGQIRDLATKIAGDPAQLKLAELELDTDSEATEAEPAYDDVELHLTATDGTLLTFEIDDAIKIDGTWKFKGRVEDRFSIELTDP